MSWRRRIGDMPLRTKRLLAAGAAVVIAIVAAWAIAASLDRDERRGQARPADVTMVGDVGGMADMSMDPDGSVRLTADQIRTFGVTFGRVERRRLTDEIRTVGIVSFDETRIARVTPKFSGYVEQLYVDFTGQQVRRGQALLAIYSPELVAAQEELLLARRLEKSLGEGGVPGVPAGSTDLVEAAARRLRLWDISEQQIEEILRTGRARRTLTLYAPVSGIVVEKNVFEGGAVRAGEALYTIANLSEVWIEAELQEAEAGLVKPGMPATVELASLAGGPIAGTVEYVYPTLQEQSRTLKARIAIPNPEGLLKPGMYATVRITAPARTALTVPVSAVLRTGENSIVFVDQGGGRLLPVEIELGRVAGEYVEVLRGLLPGQRVVTSAQYLLDAESNLGQVMRSMIGQMGTADMGGMDMEGMEMPKDRR